MSHSQSDGNGVAGSNSNATTNFDDDRPARDDLSTPATTNLLLQNLASDGDKNIAYLVKVTTAIRVMESKFQTSDSRYTHLKSVQSRLLRKFYTIDRLKNPVNANISSEHNRQLASQATFFSYLKSTPSVPSQLMQAALLRQPLSSGADASLETADSANDLIQASLQQYIIQEHMHWPKQTQLIFPKPEGIIIPTKFTASSTRIIEQQAAVEVDASIKARRDIITERLKQFESSCSVHSAANYDLGRCETPSGGMARNAFHELSAMQSSVVQQTQMPEYVRLQAELKALNLRELQRRVRKDFDAANQSDTPAAAVVEADQHQRYPVSMKTFSQSRDERRRFIINQMEERRERSHRQRLLTAVLQHHREFKETHKQNQQRASKIVRAVGMRLLTKEREREKEQERTERERMKRLMLENEAEYCAVVARKRDQRLAQFLQQTDQFIAQLTDLVMQHKSQAAPRTTATSDNFSGESSTANPASAVILSDDARVREVLKATRREDEAFFSSMEHATNDNILPAKSHSSGENTQPAAPSSDNNQETGVVDEAYYAVAHSVSERITEQPSIMRGGKLKDYQLRGLEWLVSLYNNHLNGILADEMGLGKTVQTIALIAYLVEKKHMTGPYIIIVPLSTMCNWMREFEYWAPSLVTIAYSGTKADRAAMMPRIKAKRFNVLITTYDYVMRDTHKLKKVDWQYMIIDEGHRMKNAQCKLTLTLNKYYDVKHRLLLTGTPLQNRLPELWALLNFVLPSIFKSSDTFEQWFNAPFALPGEKDKVELKEEDTMLIVRRLHKVLRPFLLRRLKKEVATELPDKLEYVVKCPMSALQRVLYEHMEKYKTIFNSQAPTVDADADSEDFFALTTSGTASSVNYAAAANSNKKEAVLSNTIMQLRKICNHPFLFQGCEKTIGQHLGYADGYVNGPDLYRVCGKFEMLDRLLPKLQRSGHRCLIFCQMTTLMSILEDFLRMRNMTYLRLDGSTKADERDALMEKFRAADSPYFVFLLSTRAGGVGLNLQAADTVIIFDQDWNPTQDQQAQDRVHRIGQKRKVLVLRLLTVNSIEERIEAAAQRKRDMDQVVIQAGLFDAKSTVSERQQFLQSILGSRNTAAVSSSSVKTNERQPKANNSNGDGDENELLTANAADADAVDIPDDEMMNEMISRSTEEFELFQSMDVERVEHDKAELYNRPRLMQENELPPFMQQPSIDSAIKFGRSFEVSNVNSVVTNETKTKTGFESPLAIRSLLGLEPNDNKQTDGDSLTLSLAERNVLTTPNDIYGGDAVFANVVDQTSNGDDRPSSIASSASYSASTWNHPVHAIAGDMSLSPEKKTISIVTPQIGRMPSIYTTTASSLEQPLAAAAVNNNSHRVSKRKRKVLYDNLGDSKLFEDENAAVVPRKRGRPPKNPADSSNAIDAADSDTSSKDTPVSDDILWKIPVSEKVRTGKRGRPKGSTAARKLELMQSGEMKNRFLLGGPGSAGLQNSLPVPQQRVALSNATATEKHFHGSTNNGDNSIFPTLEKNGNSTKPDSDYDSFWLPKTGGNQINTSQHVAPPKVSFLAGSGAVPNRFATTYASTPPSETHIDPDRISHYKLKPPAANLWSTGGDVSTQPTVKPVKISAARNQSSAATFRIAKKLKPTLLHVEKTAVDASAVPNGNSSLFADPPPAVSLGFPRNRLLQHDVESRSSPVPHLLVAPNQKFGSFGQVLKSCRNSLNHHSNNKPLSSSSIFPTTTRKRARVSHSARKNGDDSLDETTEEGELNDSDDSDEYYDNVSDEADDDDDDDNDADEHDEISSDDDGVIAANRGVAVNGVRKTAVVSSKALNATKINKVAAIKIRTGSTGVFTASSSASSGSSSVGSSQLSTASSSIPPQTAPISGAGGLKEPGVIVREEINGPLGTSTIKLRIKF